MSPGAASPRLPISYGNEVEAAVEQLLPALAALHLDVRADARSVALRLLEGEPVTTALVT